MTDNLSPEKQPVVSKELTALVNQCLQDEWENGAGSAYPEFNDAMNMSASQLALLRAIEALEKKAAFSDEFDQALDDALFPSDSPGER